ncbi:alpha/beta hydrolase [Carboxydothermus islandicus]|uniref:Alpha/beta hydrolase n=1 Tax=Carboxydothermus islandicus TaxID=661089 RepID=A0A1L8D0L6_9THEO|nr:alpha/beta hydrolase [Carboxydothermus islandicus]GAV24679.1 alpha/beta hydrolase [Carboxydothermus islandicus]
MPVLELQERQRLKIRKLFLITILLLLLLILAIGGISGYVGWNLTHPVREKLEGTPADYGLPFEEVSFTSREDGLKLRGWFIPAASNDTVIFAHGYRKNRLQLDVPVLPIAKKVYEHGWNVLLFDFRNSGESEGNLTSVGLYEVNDLLGAVDFIRQEKKLSGKIVLHGFSMGAATAIITGAREENVAGVIADSPFADLKPYLMENLSVWSGLPSVPFNQAFLIVVPPLTGLDPTKVSPIKELPKLAGRPLLLIHGDKDTDVPLKNSILLKNAYPQAELWVVLGATHVKNYAVAGEKYVNKVIEFLNKVKGKG